MLEFFRIFNHRITHGTPASPASTVSGVAGANVAIWDHLRLTWDQLTWVKPRRVLSILFI